jgi:hypothetical protein
MFIPRVAGLIAHLIESIDDPDYKIFRPRQIYTGPDKRTYKEFLKEDVIVSPEITSSNIQYFRPGFEMPSDDHELYQDLDFEKQFAAIKEFSGTNIGSRIRSWLSAKQSQSNLRQAKGSVTVRDEVKVVAPLVKESSTSRTETNAPNLLAGSKNSRVISSSKQT